MNNNFNSLKENVTNKFNHFSNITGFKYSSIEFHLGNGNRVSSSNEYGTYTFNPYITVDFGEVDLYNPDKKHSKRFTSLVEKLENKYGIDIIVD